MAVMMLRAPGFEVGSTEYSGGIATGTIKQLPILNTAVDATQSGWTMRWWLKGKIQAWREERRKFSEVHNESGRMFDVSDDNIRWYD